MFEPSIFIAVFPYAFIAAFPIIGTVIITKMELDRRRRAKRVRGISSTVV